MTNLIHFDSVTIESYKYSHIIFFSGEKVDTIKYQELEQKVLNMQIQIHPDFQRQYLESMPIKKLIQQFNPKILS